MYSVQTGHSRSLRSASSKSRTMVSMFWLDRGESLDVKVGSTAMSTVIIRALLLKQQKR
jgi:hypothetical protein